MGDEVLVIFSLRFGQFYFIINLCLLSPPKVKWEIQHTNLKRGDINSLKACAEKMAVLMSLFHSDPI